jgi:hypothetical protein
MLLKKDRPQAHENKNYAGQGLWPDKIQNCQLWLTDSEKKRNHKRIFYSDSRNTIKKYIKHTPETVRGSAFIWSINYCCNSCDKEPWQSVIRMARLFSNTNTNNTPSSKQILLQNNTRRTKNAANFKTRSKHQQRENWQTEEKNNTIKIYPEYRISD